MPLVSRPLVWIMLFSFMSMMNGCYYFKVTKSAEPPRDVISKMQEKQKFIILHLDDKAWQFINITVNDESIEGTLSELAGHNRYKSVNPDHSNRYLKRASSDESYVLDEVHIYVSGYSEKESGKISLPIKDIQKIEVYDKDTGATTASWIFSALGVTIGVLGVIFVILLLTKSSCPFVYAWDGTDFIFTGEIFSGATQPGLERDDYLPLHRISPSEGKYKLKLTNEVYEIQSLNSARLICIDHPADISVLIDKYGTPATFHIPLPPAMATNSSGKDILQIISTKDTLNYSGDETGDGKDGIEEIIMKFPKPLNCATGKLVIRAKNSFWLDILFMRFHKLFGEKYNTFAANQESASGEDLKRFLLEQKIPLSVYLERDGKWQFTDNFNIAGPMAFRDDVLSLDLNGISSDTIKIKLETGFLFWELDYAGMDFSPNETVLTSAVEVSTALDNNGTEVKDLLYSRDKNYLVLKEVGDEVLLDFNEPPVQDMERTLFLHTSGYYKILREQKGYADRKTLKTFRKPNRFPEFSKEMYGLLPLE